MSTVGTQGLWYKHVLLLPSELLCFCSAGEVLRPTTQLGIACSFHPAHAMQAALHNLASHDGSPLSSASCPSAASSSQGGSTHPAPVTRITPNECFDGSALFNSTASASGAASGGAPGSVHDRHHSPHSTDAGPSRHSHQKRPDTAATVASRRDNGDQPASLQVGLAEPSVQWRVTERQQQPSGGQLSSQNHQLPGQTARQLPGQMPSQVPEQRHPQAPTAQLPTASTGRSRATAGHASSVSRAKATAPSQAAAATLLQDSESSEELMTLEELEERIAGLNTTLLREPTCQQAPQRPHHVAGSRQPRSLFHGHQRLAASEQRQMQAGEQLTRRGQVSKLGGQAYQSGSSASEQPARTAWQKLTAKHQVLQAGIASPHSDEDGEADSHSSASSPPGCTVSSRSHSGSVCVVTHATVRALQYWTLPLAVHKD